MDITINVIDQLEHRLQNITGQIEVVEFLTPLKVVRYTGNRQGSQEG